MAHPFPTPTTTTPSLTIVTNTSTSESYAYDPLGNRRTKTAGGITLDYTYDNANQLIEVKQGATRTAGLIPCSLRLLLGLLTILLPKAE